MPSPSRIEIDALLAPIPGDSAAGSPVSFVARKKMDDARKEVHPESFAPDDPRRPEQPVLADWPGIERMTVETLTTTSKDLLVAARLTEALTKQYGFGGARDGILLLRRLVEEAWDRVNPPIEEGDLEPRAAAFNWLGDPARGAFFPNTLRQAPIVERDGERFGWQYWRDVQDGKANAVNETFERAIQATSRDDCQTVVDDLEECLTEVDGLSNQLDAKMAEAAPSLGEVRKALQDCQGLAQEILNRKGPAPGAAEDEAPAEEAANGEAPAKTSAAPRRANTREEIYARLAELSAQLVSMEPHSPVAYLIQRAVKLGQLPLPQLMKVLIRNQDVLSELNRDLDLGYEE